MAFIKDFKEIPLEDLSIGLGQVRIRHVSKEIDELADSIAQVGLLEPIVVCPTEEEGKYEIMTGQRRFLAHQELGKQTIWAAILDQRVDEITAKVLSVTENLVRRDLHPGDLIDVCTYLYHQYGSLKMICDKTGLSYEKVRQYVKYDQLIPQLKNLVDSGDVKLNTALRAQRASIKYGEPDADEAVQFAKEMEPMSGAQQGAMVKKREDDPGLSADEVIEDAKSGGKVTQVFVTLTSEVHGALRKYATSQQTSPDDAAGMLIRQALYLNDLLEDQP